MLTQPLRIAVFGGTGLIGQHITAELRAAGHDARPHARATGVDLMTGVGLAEALIGVDVAIDATQAPVPDFSAANFFQTTASNLHAAALEAGVGHLVLLSIVGVDQVPNLGYYQAKTVQEKLFESAPVPFSIVRATQFFEYVDEILAWTSDSDVVRLPSTRLRPIAADDAASFIADIATGSPLGGTIDVVGPEVLGLDEIGRITSIARRDTRPIRIDDSAGPFALAAGDVLTSPAAERVGATRYRDWLATRLLPTSST
ncbi:SDR family oxidoreductase [Nocardia camponoti]|uniref:LysR family transcriptional regulator n=1 Tax=Nocardia camponoti TaxID=1616106 RepID=A0A917Q9V6_9NOCA|nr:NAD(P)H-binding protein [Nocardia camponoti]GGK36878.1 LysR family transcriptional regulator [Nocardia camponoti]